MTWFYALLHYWHSFFLQLLLQYFIPMIIPVPLLYNKVLIPLSKAGRSISIHQLFRRPAARFGSSSQGASYC